jgi:outer membrane protein TolC
MGGTPTAAVNRSASKERDAPQARARASTVDATRLQVAQATIALEAAGRQGDAAEAAVTVAEAALAEASTLFEAGRLSSPEVLDRELALAEARAELVEARIAWRLGLARLERLTG